MAALVVVEVLNHEYVIGPFFGPTFYFPTQSRWKFSSPLLFNCFNVLIQISVFLLPTGHHDVGNCAISIMRNLNMFGKNIQISNDFYPRVHLQPEINVAYNQNFRVNIVR